MIRPCASFCIPIAAARARFMARTFSSCASRNTLLASSPASWYARVHLAVSWRSRSDCMREKATARSASARFRAAASTFLASWSVDFSVRSVSFLSSSSSVSAFSPFLSFFLTASSSCS